LTKIRNSLIFLAIAYKKTMNNLNLLPKHSGAVYQHSAPAPKVEDLIGIHFALGLPHYYIQAQFIAITTALLAKSDSDWQPLQKISEQVKPGEFFVLAGNQENPSELGIHKVSDAALKAGKKILEARPNNPSYHYGFPERHKRLVALGILSGTQESAEPQDSAAGIIRHKNSQKFTPQQATQEDPTPSNVTEKTILKALNSSKIPPLCFAVSPLVAVNHRPNLFSLKNADSCMIVVNAAGLNRLSVNTQQGNYWLTPLTNGFLAKQSAASVNFGVSRPALEYPAVIKNGLDQLGWTPLASWSQRQIPTDF
jgi:hypothetical protein